MDEITSVKDVVDILHSSEFHTFRKFSLTDHRAGTEYKYPFGIWFRGQPDASHKLTPGIFRARSNLGKVYLEETSMFNHFQLRVPEHHQAYRNTFDWLCLMQHYNMPTRLLDWTENALIALFFAVENCEEYSQVEGRFYTLNARRLNKTTSWAKRQSKENICTPTSYDVAARSQLTVSRNIYRWIEHMTALAGGNSWFKGQIPSESEVQDIGFKQWLASPVAVFPNRLNGRMVLQSSMFTLHGGKQYRDGDNNSADALPEPRNLEDINSSLKQPSDKFLKSYLIPKGDYKKKIKEELLILGIHPGSLFPELDRQATYVKERWTFDIP